MIAVLETNEQLDQHTQVSVRVSDRVRLWIPLPAKTTTKKLNRDID